MIKTDFSTLTFQAHLAIDPSVKIKNKDFLQKNFRYFTKEYPKDVLIITSSKKQSNKTDFMLSLKNTSFQPILLEDENFKNINSKLSILETLVNSFKAIKIYNTYEQHINKLTDLKNKIYANIEKFKESKKEYQTIMDTRKAELAKSNFNSELKQGTIRSCESFIEYYTALVEEHKEKLVELDKYLESLNKNKTNMLKNLSTNKLNFIEKFNH